MKRIFRYDKKKNALIIQSIIMIMIAFAMFFQYSQEKKIVYLVLVAFAMIFVAIYFYRIFIMRVVFENDQVTFKGLSKQYTIKKEDVYDIQLLKQIGREVNNVKYLKGGNYKEIGSKTYVLIRRTGGKVPTTLSMFSAANDNYISLEYLPEIELYLDKILP